MVNPSVQAPSLSPAQKRFQQQMLSPRTFTLFKLTKLPLAFFAQLKIDSLDTSHCTCSLPYNYFTKNPFKSIYFAGLTMAAELSTGALVLLATMQQGRSFSTLVTGTEAEFHKKAVGRTAFTCSDGEKVFAALAKSRETGEAQTVTTKTEGRLADGTLVATMHFTWSVKERKKK